MALKYGMWSDLSCFELHQLCRWIVLWIRPWLSYICILGFCNHLIDLWIYQFAKMTLMIKRTNKQPREYEIGNKFRFSFYETIPGITFSRMRSFSLTHFQFWQLEVLWFPTRVFVINGYILNSRKLKKRKDWYNYVVYIINCNWYVLQEVTI